MLSREENEYLTRTGPGTPCGELMRRYWQPVALSEELESEAPLKVKVLGEELVLFRDDQGRVGLLGLHCSSQWTPGGMGLEKHTPATRRDNFGLPTGSQCRQPVPTGSGVHENRKLLRYGDAQCTAGCGHGAGGGPYPGP